VEKIQKIGVSAFILRNGRVLIVRRSKKEKFMSGYFDLPGGKVDFGETLKQAVIREIKEETNLKVKEMHPYSSFSYLSSNGTRHNVDVQFLVSVEDLKKLKLSDAHDDFKWIKLSEINKYKMSKERKKSIRLGFSALKNLLK
jgi:8-oxo-dGTP diphosphatase